MIGPATGAAGEAQWRLSIALEQLGQAKAVFNFVLFALRGFRGTGDYDWDHRLAAEVNVSQLLGHFFDADYVMIERASAEIVTHRLPRLLVIALVDRCRRCGGDLACRQAPRRRPRGVVGGGRPDHAQSAGGLPR